ncbi:MAG: hypothetical protein WB992_07205 [Bryobacteraceae bacterium]
MAKIILCKICGKRRARRECPAVHGEICPLCCGAEREVSLSCPLECEYLQEAHRHEKAIPVSAEELAYTDIEVTEEFLADQEELLLFCIYTLLEAALETPGAVDSDVVSALEALIQTHRTLQSGLVYETRAENNVAASVQRSFAASLTDYRKLKTEREGFSVIRDSDILKILVFLLRIGQHNRNGRPRGRMYLDLLRSMTPGKGVEDRGPSIIL